MSNIVLRNFAFKVFEFVYYRLLKRFYKPRNINRVFFHLYSPWSLEQSNVYFKRKFYYNPLTDIGRWLFFKGGFESEDVDLCHKFIKKDSVVLDIGANIGYHSIHFAEMAKEGKVIAFEPARKTFVQLLKNTEKYNNVMPINIGMGDENKLLTFYEAVDDAYSGFKNTQRKKLAKTFPVLCLRGDDWILDSGFDKIDFIKIDVEGFEQQLLEGLEETIKKYKPVIFCEIVESPNSNKDPLQTINMMKSWGYDIQVIQDGKIVPFIKHDNRYQNYFFIPN